MTLDKLVCVKADVYFSIFKPVEFVITECIQTIEKIEKIMFLTKFSFLPYKEGLIIC